MRSPLMKNTFIDLNLKVKDLIDHRAKRWDRDKLNELFFHEDVERILRIKLVVAKNDYRIWKYNRSGAFSVKSGYWLVNKGNKAGIIQEAEIKPSTNELRNEIWNMKTSPKIKVFLWKMLSEALPIVDLISKRGMTIDLRCRLCGLEGESINHVISRVLWQDRYGL